MFSLTDSQLAPESHPPAPELPRQLVPGRTLSL